MTWNTIPLSQTSLLFCYFILLYILRPSLWIVQADFEFILTQTELILLIVYICILRNWAYRPVSASLIITDTQFASLHTVLNMDETRRLNRSISQSLWPWHRDETKKTAGGNTFHLCPAAFPCIFPSLLRNWWHVIWVTVKIGDWSEVSGVIRTPATP